MCEAKPGPRCTPHAATAYESALGQHTGSSIATEPSPLDRAAGREAEITTTHEAVAWADAGFTLTSAEPWHAAGFDPQAAATWRRGGFLPTVAKPWHEQGFDNPQHALAWAEARVLPSEARAFIDIGVTNPKVADKWRYAGPGTTTPERVEPWVNAGFTHPAGDDIDTADGYASYGFTAAQAGPWHRAGFRSGEAAAWRDANFPILAAAEYRANGMTPEQAEADYQAWVRDNTPEASDV